ncbi:zinc finger protein RFP-like isoform X2 [Lissotriton helveticus]
MAVAAQSQNLEDEVTCSICLEYFKTPVIIGCGHIFCQSCISRCWQGSDTNLSCPECREISQEKKLQPIRQLGNLVEMLKNHLPSLKPQENVCEKHQQRLQLFCEDDQEPICVVCDRSRDHRAHTVVPVEEAAQEYKGEYLSQAEKITRTFEDLQQFLEQEKKNILGKLETEQTEHLQKISLKITDLEKQNACLKNLIEELEGVCHQQDVELLTNVRYVLYRSDSVKVLLPKNDSVGSNMQSLKSFSSHHAYIQEKIKEFKEVLTRDPDTAALPKSGSQKPAKEPSTVCLDFRMFSESINSTIELCADEDSSPPFFTSLSFADADENLEGSVIKLSAVSNVDICQSPVESAKMASKLKYDEFIHPIRNKKNKNIFLKRPVKRTDAAQPLAKEPLDVTQRTFCGALTPSTRIIKSGNVPYASTGSSTTGFVESDVKYLFRLPKSHGYPKPL